jgi:hypothetical protein
VESDLAARQADAVVGHRQMGNKVPGLADASITITFGTDAAGSAAT